MRILVVGGGLTGLTAMHKLLKMDHSVVLMEKDKELGGLAGSFTHNNWKWQLEKYYHHLFTNDVAISNLARELGLKIIINRPRTDLLYQGKVYPFDSIISLLKFPPLSLLDKFRLGVILLFLKLTNNYRKFEKIRALAWLEKYAGKNSTSMIWKPLFIGKFGRNRNKISLTWFWARIKKRTHSLAYPERGFAGLTEKLMEEIIQMGGEIKMGRELIRITSLPDGVVVQQKGGKIRRFDEVLVTTPSEVVLKLIPKLPKHYVRKLSSIKHLSALVLIMRLKKRFMKNTYWLNVNEKGWPLLTIVEHTNYMSSKYYGDEHLVYVGNYLPDDHQYLSMTPKRLLAEFDPFLKMIREDYKDDLIDLEIFSSPNAQPIVDTNYRTNIPEVSPLGNIFVANMDMVYPWDRGSNYAVEMGQRMAKLIDESRK